MQPRHRRIAIAATVLVLAQAAAIAIYVTVKQGRSSPNTPPFGAETLASRDAPALPFERENGSTATLAQMKGKVVMVHFWATWCEPCRKELPGLLSLAAELEIAGGFALIAVSVDDEWDEMRMFFDGRIPTPIVRSTESEVHRRFGASTLPDTYLVDTRGKIAVRYAGSRDWRSSPAREHLRQAIKTYGASR